CRKISRRLRAEPACDSRLHFVVTGKMLSEQEHFQELEQMVVARSKIGTIGWTRIKSPRSGARACGVSEWQSLR
ncbi:hypothetical protein AVEN_213584-1, partial [Araneus ventricosus]